jgi:hypothetical protein
MNERERDEQKPDGYFVNMGTLCADALTDVLRPDLTPRRKEIIAEYLAGLLDNFYNMGIRLGQLKEQMEARLIKE